MNQNNVKEVLYNPSNNILHVVYVSGAAVDFSPVNPETYQEMIAGDSLSRAVNKITRSGNVVGIKAN